jgi:predicted MPP superfamily phosphohydrolase
VRALDWSRLSTTSRPELFQRIHDQIEKRRRAGVVVLFTAELQEVLGGVDSAALATVVDQLERRGAIAEARLASGERVLVLSVDWIDRYAGSLVMAARHHPRGVPALEERQILSPTLGLPRLAERLPRAEERFVLEAVVQLLVDHELCFVDEGLLIFPSLFSPSEAPAPLPHSVSLFYVFSGAIDNIYASLVTSLKIAEAFGRPRLWEWRAEFARPGEGACGVRKVDRGGGSAHLDIYFEPATPAATRDLFMSFVEQHLSRHGVTIEERVEVTCACGFQFTEKMVRARLERGDADIGCPECDHRTPIGGGVADARARDPQLERRSWALRMQVEERKRRAVDAVASQVQAPREAGPIRVLHLSDLHVRADADPIAITEPLAASLRDAGVEALDYLVLSGDLTNRASPGEFETVRRVVSDLVQRFRLTAERCVVVPGNHDLDWGEPVYEWRGRRPNDTASLPAGQFVAEERVLGVRTDRYPQRFAGFSRHFYHPLLQREYPLAFEDQGQSFLYGDDRLQFLAFNSSWQIDEFFRERSGLHEGAVARALDRAEAEVVEARRAQRLADGPLLRIAVWHHPVTGRETMADVAFLERLRQANVKLCLHGHVHEDTAELVGYTHPRRLHIVGAGSFGAPPADRPESTPKLCNLLEIARDLSRVRVHTRQQARAGGAWDGWPHWKAADGRFETFYDIVIT